MQWEADQARAHQLAQRLRQKYHQLSTSKPSIRSTNHLVSDKRSRQVKNTLTHATLGLKILEREKKLLRRERPEPHPIPLPTPSSKNMSKVTSIPPQFFGHIT
ncbi:hypothetical protein HMI55_005607 [Coelomomyces lativittatus]|nr:hypothetical protein HMI56_000044 [Coelomomyces lativittatus]KAJ1513414.1 hypothetical protein HMI55_005607 [Coelomomyces lativittatus]